MTTDAKKNSVLRGRHGFCLTGHAARSRPRYPCGYPKVCQFRGVHRLRGAREFNGKRLLDARGAVFGSPQPVLILAQVIIPIILLTIVGHFCI